MQISSKCPISDEALERYNRHRSRTLAIIDESKLPDLVCIILQVYEECLETPDIFAGSSLNEFTGDIVSKFISESWGLVGALEHGAYASCFHQARSVIELVSQYNWVVSKGGKREKRLNKYFAYKDLYEYQSMLKAESNPALMASLKRKGVYRDPLEWRNELEEWAKLYGVKPEQLSKVKGWLHPATIENTIIAAPGGNDLQILYDFFSRVTHVSSQTIKVAGPKVLGLPGDKEESVAAVDNLVINTCAVWGVMLGLVQEYHGHNFKARFPAFMSQPSR